MKAGRKATGLTPVHPGFIAAELPGDEHIQIKSSNLCRLKPTHPLPTGKAGYIQRVGPMNTSYPIPH